MELDLDEMAEFKKEYATRVTAVRASEVALADYGSHLYTVGSVCSKTCLHGSLVEIDEHVRVMDTPFA